MGYTTFSDTPICVKCQDAKVMPCWKVHCENMAETSEERCGLKRHGTRLENRTRFCEMHNFFPKRGSNNGKPPLIEHRAVNIRNSYLDGKFDFTFRGLKPEINEPPEFVLAQRFSDEEAL